MAIYRKGQASMDADGYITGYGTEWKTALTLIRPGATIVFATNPVAYATISEIVNDTSLRATSTGGAVVPQSDYVILLHDSITVDGLAQDVAETLRYYQSKETVIQDAIDFLKDFDWEQFVILGDQVKSDANTASNSATSASASKDSAASSAAAANQSDQYAYQHRVAAESAASSAAGSASGANASKDAAAVSASSAAADAATAVSAKNAAADSAFNAKTSETNAGNSATASAQSERNAFVHRQDAETAASQAGASKDAAKASETNAWNSANSASQSATTATQQADRAKTEADRAASANPDNQLKKANNLSDLADLATARSNFQVDRLIQSANSTTLGKLNGVRLYLNDAGNAWSVVDSSFNPLALPVEGGGTGSKTAAGARTNLGLKTAATRDVGLEPGNVLETGAFGLGSRNLTAVSDLWDKTLGTRMLNMTPSTSGAPPGGYSVALRLSDRNIGSGSQPFQQQSFSTIAVSNGVIYVMSMADGNVWGWNTVYTTGNTTRAADGTLKVASPIVKIFSDGRCELNDESEGCEVSRLGVGEYLIEGCKGLNSDAAWGGIDGGFDIPTDRNKQPLIWLDYEVNPDGSILVKTYHREHPDSPKFAQNKIEGFSNGDPIDVPVSQFISVRVEMP